MKVEEDFKNLCRYAFCVKIGNTVKRYKSMELSCPFYSCPDGWDNWCELAKYASRQIIQEYISPEPKCEKCPFDSWFIIPTCPDCESCPFFHGWPHKKCFLELRNEFQN